MKICPICSRRFPDEALFCPDDGAGLVPMPERTMNVGEPEPILDQDNLVGTSIFGDYIIKKKLGEGGMGAVYLAENKSIDQKIAIKVLHGHAAQNEELVKRFNREAQAISRLTHPNIIRVFIFGRTPEGLIYLAMEFVEGKPLRDIIQDGGRIDELRAIGMLRQVLHALHEAHEIGIVHRDLKPDNIMLTRFRGVDDYVKVLDFGIAKVKQPDGKAQQKLTQAGVVYGTPEYLSPEQAQAKELDGRSDLYSTGIILYEMMTGMVPFQSNTAVAILASHVYDQPKKPSEITKRSIHPKMERIIMRAIEKDPNKRYATAMEFLADLESLESELAGEAVTRTTVLDPRQLALVLDVARSNAQRRDPKAPPKPAAASPAPAPAAAPPAPAAPAPAPPGPSPVLKSAAPTPVTKPDNAVLYTVIGGLVILVLILVAAIVMLLGKTGSAPAAQVEQPPGASAPPGQ
jgi:serine/threonine-protein kinase